MHKCRRDAGYSIIYIVFITFMIINMYIINNINVTDII